MASQKYRNALLLTQSVCAWLTCGAGGVEPYLAGLGWGLRVSISHDLRGGAYDAGPWYTLGNKVSENSALPQAEGGHSGRRYPESIYPTNISLVPVNTGSVFKCFEYPLLLEKTFGY